MAHNEIPDVFDKYGDYLNPVWAEGGRVQNWRNYINEQLREIWHTFTDEQKRVIAWNAEELADREHWD